MRKYTVLFFPDDNSIEIVCSLPVVLISRMIIVLNLDDDQVDMKSRKVFLKRNKTKDTRLRDLFVGATVNLFSRQVCSALRGVIMPDVVCR